jgi:O-antigen/teichoic acid export membrane protein
MLIVSFRFWKFSLKFNFKNIISILKFSNGYSFSIYITFAYKALPKLLAGHFIGHSELAIYDLSEKLMLIIKSPIQALARVHASENKSILFGNILCF